MAPHGAPIKRRILVAGAADTVHTVCAILGDAFEYLPAFSMTGALARLDEGGFDLILCGLRFDDGDTIDFLKLLRREPQLEGLALVCFHAHGWEPSASACRTVRRVLEGFGNAQFVDLYAIARAENVAGAAAALRRAVSTGLEEAACA